MGYSLQNSPLKYFLRRRKSRNGIVNTKFRHWTRSWATSIQSTPWKLILLKFIVLLHHLFNIFKWPTSFLRSLALQMPSIDIRLTCQTRVNILNVSSPIVRTKEHKSWSSVLQTPAISCVSHQFPSDLCSISNHITCSKAGGLDIHTEWRVFHLVVFYWRCGVRLLPLMGL
jgi:hypothetical protein